MIPEASRSGQSREASRRREAARLEAELVAAGSIELSAHRSGDARAIAELLPVGTRVYVNHLPQQRLMDAFDCLMAVRDAGLEPVPHLSARRIEQLGEAASFIEHAVQRAGVSKVLLIGGDSPRSCGPFADAAALLRSGVLKDSGVREVGLPAYPEGHPLIPSDRLAQAFAEKLGLIAEQGLSPYVVTQFCFAPLRIIECCVDLALRAPQVLVYVGMAGPTSPLRLASYARRCGVSASLRALGAQGMGAVRLVTHTDPTEQLKVVAHHCRSRPQSNVVGVHLFSFGGAQPTARWMHRRMMLAEGAEP